MKVLITGANGFIGSHLVEELEKAPDIKLVKLSRSGKVGFVESPLLEKDSNWKCVLSDVDIVIHLAARAHVVGDIASHSLDSFLESNRDATLNLAAQCLDMGVKKFIFFSTVGVHAGLADTQVITADSEFLPIDDYAVSKVEAEIALNKMFKRHSSQLIILRPPLIFAGNAPGNFKTLLSLTEKCVPLPFGNIENKRSILSIKNLTGLIKILIEIETDVSGSYLVADDQVVSTKNIISCLSEGMKRKNRVFNFPYVLLNKVVKVLGKTDVLNKICGDFEVDNSLIKEVSGWRPKYETEKELKKAGQEYLKNDTITNTRKSRT